MTQPAPSLCCAGDLPAGASINEDRSVTLKLSTPLPFKVIAARAPQVGTWSADTLHFGRVSGGMLRKHRATKSLANAAISASLGVGFGTVDALLRAVQEDDRAAIKRVMFWLLDLSDGIPERARPQTDGSFVLQLLCPAFDGQQLRLSLHLRPLAPERVDQAFELTNQRMPFVLHHATGLPLKVAISLMNAMDFADLSAVERTVLPAARREAELRRLLQ